jgi:hypothetical protein
MIPGLFFAITCGCAVLATFAMRDGNWGRTLGYLLVGCGTAYLAVATLPTAFSR